MPDLFSRDPVHADFLRHVRALWTNPPGEVVSHDLVDLAVFEIKVDVFRGQDTGLDLIR